MYKKLKMINTKEQKKKNFMDDKFKDYKGYIRFKDSKRLFHRWMAEKEIYDKNKKKYTLPFEEYQVHHIDKVITNNIPENLKLLTKREHEEIHGKIRAEWVIIYGFMVWIATGLFLSNWVKIADSRGLSNIVKISGFFTITLLGFIIFALLTRETKKRKFI